MSDQRWWLYVIETEKGQLYTGITTDVERRFSEHQAVFEKTPRSKAKKGAKFFRSTRPVSVAYKKSYANRSEASKAESEWKKLTAKAKRELLFSDLD